MGLSNELISQFAKVTNDKKVSRIDEVTLYGAVVKCDDTVYVKFDGSEELTPVTTVTEKDEDGNIVNFKYGAASVKTGDRVSVVLKNHSATITGNLTDPPMGRAEVKVGEDSIVAKVGEDVKVQIDAMGVRIDNFESNVNLTVNNMGVQINGLATFTNTTSQKVDDLSSGLSNGTTTIDGGCIKTGLIDAKRISLKGLITYQYSVDGSDDSWHYPVADGDMYRRESIDGGTTWGDPYQFVGKNGQNGKDGQDGQDGSDADVPSYIKLRGIDFTDITNNYIKSPKIYGGEFYGNEFNVISDGSGEASFSLYGELDSKQYHFLKISYYDGGGPIPYVNIFSPDGAALNIGSTSGYSIIYFGGRVDFSSATVTGLTATFA